MSFEGKVVLITGAASGIGNGAAQHFVRLGAKVSLVDINGELLNRVVDDIASANATKPLSIVADVTKDEKFIIDDTIKHFGQLDVLVNNAGIFASDSVIDFDLDQFDRILDTNLKSVVILTHYAVPYLEKTKGNIVNISSIAGLKAFGSFNSYCISKAGLDHFTKCAAIALAPKGIRCNAINPGMKRTPIYETIGMVNELNKDTFFDEHKSNFLVGRVGKVSDTSAAIAYLASESFINGISLQVDGGLMLSGSQALKNYEDELQTLTK